METTQVGLHGLVTTTAQGRHRAWLTRVVDDLSRNGDVVGLVAFGSTAAISRVDEWSDHDIAIVTLPGSQERYRDGVATAMAHSSLRSHAPESRDRLDVLRRAELAFPSLAVAIDQACALPVDECARALLAAGVAHFGVSPRGIRAEQLTALTDRLGWPVAPTAL